MEGASVLEQCESFEWRGPMLASLSRVAAGNLEILREVTDWDDVTQGKPVTDNRCSDLADLYPNPRAMLDKLLDGLNETGKDNGYKPRMG